MKKSEKKVLTSPDCHGIIIVVGSPDWLSGNKKSKSLGYRQAVRHWILTPAFRRFESFYPSHVGAGFTAPIFSFEKINRTFSCSSFSPKKRAFLGTPPLRGKAGYTAPIFLYKKSVGTHRHQHSENLQNSTT